MKKIKFKSAEEKRRHEENQKQWKELQSKYAPKKPLWNVKSTSPEVTKLAVRETRTVSSRVTPGGSTALKETKTYTGDKMIGIGVLHKSNGIPIFRSEDATDLASMRR